MPHAGFAQYKFPIQPFFSYFRDLQRYEIGGGVVLPFGEYSGSSVPVLNPSKYQQGDTTISRSIAGDLGFGASIGLSLPFKATGHISYWAAHIEIMANEYIWQNLNPSYGTDGTFKNNAVSLNAVTQQISLPLGVEWKVGTDAIKSKRLTFGATLGAGVIPQFNITALEGVKNFDNGYGWGCTPYVKFDWAIFGGICWKLRLMYTYGKVNLIDVNRLVPNLTDGPFGVASNGNFMASLIIMPFSYRWEETAWYNTHDTYNQHDRFN